MHHAGANMQRLRILTGGCPLLVADEMKDRHVYKLLLLTGIERAAGKRKEGREGEGEISGSGFAFAVCMHESHSTASEGRITPRCVKSSS